MELNDRNLSCTRNVSFYYLKWRYKKIMKSHTQIPTGYALTRDYSWHKNLQLLQ